jgi:hypothetical protein
MQQIICQGDGATYSWSGIAHIRYSTVGYTQHVLCAICYVLCSHDEARLRVC